MSGFWDEAPAPAEAPLPPDPVIVRPAPILAKPPALYAFFEKHGISTETVDAFGCAVTTHEFGTLGTRPAIAFPFRAVDSDSVGYGYRPPEGLPREWDHAAAGRLFNVGSVETWDAIWWASDEIEVMALAEAGFSQTVAAPCDLDTALRENADNLGAVKQITLALPATPEGEKLREELAARMGRHRVWTVAWPDGCKTACDVLRAHGVERLQQCLHSALPWPIEGVQYVRPGLLLDLRRSKPPPVLTTGTAATDAIMRFPGEGKLVIVTGIPGHGKALSLDTPIPTPTGWTTMGELSDGDQVLDDQGRPTTVIKAHDVLLDRDCFQVGFSDGTLIEADAEHLWQIDGYPFPISTWALRGKVGAGERCKITRASSVLSRFDRKRVHVDYVIPIPSVPVRCITVDSPHRLYLAGSGAIPTHNTTWMRYVMIHTALNHNRRWLCFSPENAPWERFLAECAEVHQGRPFHRRRLPDGTWVNPMTDEQLAEAETWLAPRVQMLNSDSEDQPPSLEWILDRTRRCVLRDGVTDLLIDPWNEMEHSRPDRMTETEYVGLSLQKAKAFINRHGCNIWIVAHPKLQTAPRPGAKLLPPGLYDINGGANWANKADLGVCVYTPDNDFTHILCLKSKFRRWGVRNTKGIVSYDIATGRYYTQKLVADGLQNSVEEDA